MGELPDGRHIVGVVFLVEGDAYFKTWLQGLGDGDESACGARASGRILAGKVIKNAVKPFFQDAALELVLVGFKAGLKLLIVRLEASEGCLLLCAPIPFCLFNLDTKRISLMLQTSLLLP